MEHEVLLRNHSRGGFFVHLEIDLSLNFEIEKVSHFFVIWAFLFLFSFFSFLTQGQLSWSLRRDNGDGKLVSYQLP